MGEEGRLLVNSSYLSECFDCCVYCLVFGAEEKEKGREGDSLV